MRYGDQVIIGVETLHPYNDNVIVIPAGTRGMIVGDAGDGRASLLINAADLPSRAQLNADDAIIIAASLSVLTPTTQASTPFS